MDLFSVLQTTVEIIRSVDQYALSSKDAVKPFESLKEQLASTCKLLETLEKLVRDGIDDEDYSQPNTSYKTAENLSQGSSILRLIEDEGQMEQLQSTLKEISTWLNTLEPKSKSPRMSPSQILLRSSRVWRRKAEQFSFDLEKHKATANLVLTMALRYNPCSLAVKAETLIFWFRKRQSKTRAER